MSSKQSIATDFKTEYVWGFRFVTFLEKGDKHMRVPHFTLGVESTFLINEIAKAYGATVASTYAVHKSGALISEPVYQLPSSKSKKS
jgi:hypothetical protein